MHENQTWQQRLTSKSAEIVAAGSAKAGRLSTLISSAQGRAATLKTRVSTTLKTRVSTTLTEKTQQTRKAATALRDKTWSSLTRTQAPVHTLPQLDDISDQQRVAYYGALVAMAAADGSIDREELLLLLDTFEADTLDEAALAEVKGVLVKPSPLVSKPSATPSLRALRDSWCSGRSGGLLTGRPPQRSGCDCESNGQRGITAS